MLLDVAPELEDVEDAARDMLQLVAYENEENEVQVVFGGTKERQIEMEEYGES